MILISGYVIQNKSCLLFFIAFAIISYNITKCCIKYYRNNEIRTMLNDEYNKIHNKLYNYRYYSVQNDDNDSIISIYIISNIYIYTHIVYVNDYICLI